MVVEWKGGERGYIPYIVTDDKVHQGYSGDSHMALIQYTPGILGRSDFLRIYYNPDKHYMQITSHSPEDIPWKKLGMFIEHADPRLGTRVSFLGLPGSIPLGNLLHEDAAPLKRQMRPMPIEGFMPSGRPIRFGDRRPVSVRRHVRRRR